MRVWFTEVMMLEDQVVSVELAKKLKELGVKQGGSLFIIRVDGGHVIPNETQDWDSNRDHYYSAFTVAELGEMVPLQYELPIRSKTGEFGSALLGKWTGREVEARARLLIYLAENRPLKIDQAA